jgi:hypothetical protein
MAAKNLAYNTTSFPVEKVEQVAKQLLETAIDKELWLNAFWDVVARLEAVKAAGVVYRRS